MKIWTTHETIVAAVGPFVVVGYVTVSLRWENRQLDHDGKDCWLKSPSGVHAVNTVKNKYRKVVYHISYTGMALKLVNLTKYFGETFAVVGIM